MDDDDDEKVEDPSAENPEKLDTAAIRRFYHELKDALVILMNKQDTEFFGTLAYGLDIHALDFEQYAVNTRGVPSAAYTDGSSITFLIKDDITKEEMIFIFIHELLHIICHHHIRRGNRNPVLWNIAIDHVVNRVCKELERNKNYIKAPKGGVVFMEDIHHLDPDILPEKLYEILCKKADLSDNEKESVYKLDGESGTNGMGNGKSTSTNPYKSTQVYGKGDSSDPSYKVESEELVDADGNTTGKVKVTLTNLKTGEANTIVYDKETEDPNKFEEMKKATEELGNEARTLWYSTPSIAKGNIPGSMVQFLDNLFKVEIAWEYVMEDAIMYAVQNAVKRSWAEKNIYIRTPRLPGKRRARSPYYLVAGVDTSGSVSTNDLKTFCGVLLGSVNYYKAIHVLVHDHAIHDEIIISRSLTETALLERIQKVKGRGGTSHLEPFMRIKDIVQDERVSTILFQTDYYSDVEDIYKDFQWIKDYETIWVLNSNQEVVLNGCKTKIIRLPSENRRTSRWGY